eukprot:13415767-Alexandrium_andersonii.AAC.1
MSVANRPHAMFHKSSSAHSAQMKYLPAFTPNSTRSELELPTMQNCFGRLELEPSGPRSGVKVDPRSSQG